jgi:hypothetical protein
MVLGVIALLVWYVAYTQHVVTQLRAAGAGQGRMYARIYEALQDTSVNADPTIALLDLSRQIRESGLPLVLTDNDGRVSATANLPDGIDPSDTVRFRRYVADLDRQNPPIVEPAVGAVHLGDSAIVNGLRFTSWERRSPRSPGGLNCWPIPSPEVPARAPSRPWRRTCNGSNASHIASSASDGHRATKHSTPRRSCDGWRSTSRRARPLWRAR